MPIKFNWVHFPFLSNCIHQLHSYSYRRDEHSVSYSISALCVTAADPGDNGIWLPPINIGTDQYQVSESLYVYTMEWIDPNGNPVPHLNRNSQSYRKKKFSHNFYFWEYITESWWSTRENARSFLLPIIQIGTIWWIRKRLPASDCRDVLPGYYLSEIRYNYFWL